MVESVLVKPIAKRLQQDHMHMLGIANTMRVAGAYNHLKFRRENAYRREQYRFHFDELLEQNGPIRCPRIQMKDGWAVDTSGSLPMLDEVLRDADEIIEERSGVRTSSQGAYRSYFQEMWGPGDAERYPSFLSFATSSDVLAAVGSYLKSIPVLSTTLPAGIRVVESNDRYDDRDEPHDSQLFHIDYYSKPNVYVLVLLHDTGFENGPWSFLPLSTSQRAARELSYWSRSRRGYRMSDEEVYSVVDKDELIEFCYPRGTVLFIESSGCLHFGSRNSVKPRFQLFYGYHGVCRTDFSELLRTPQKHTIRDDDSKLRKMVLDNRFTG
jgi:hypothetical protein